MQTAELILFRFGGNHLHLPVKRCVLMDVYGNQTALLLPHNADFR